MPARNKPEIATGRPFNRSLALVIGIDAYQNGYPELETAINDAQAVADLLAQPPHNYEVTILTDAQATTVDLENALDKTKPGSWAGRIGPEDRVLFYFAGHGIKEQSEEGQGPTGFLLLQNADYTKMGEGRLGMIQLQEWLANLPCRHMLVVLDCCFAGAMRWTAPGLRDIPPEVIHKERYDHYVAYPAWQLITSAGDDEKAMDIIRQGMETASKEIVSFPEEKIPEVLRQIRQRSIDDNHSPFAKAFIEALRDGAGDIFPPSQPGQEAGDGLITASELVIYLENRVSQVAREAKHRQVPKLHPLAKHSSGEFVFLNPNREMQLKSAPDLNKDNNPYRVDALTEADAELFYGRESKIGELLEAVLKKPLALVTGASGVGKSSLVRAGLIPRFTGYKPPKRPGETESDESPAPNPDKWRVLPTFIPNDTPTEALRNLLQSELRDEISTDVSPDLRILLAAWQEDNPQRSVLLVIDQLERVLPQPTAPDLAANLEVEPFFNQLQTLINFKRCHLVLVLPEGYKPELEKLLDVKSEHTFELMPLDSESVLQKALERPAWARVLYFDPPELVTDIVVELNRGPGALSLLAAFGSRMYLNFIARKSQSRAITQVDYQNVGSVSDFICEAADAIYHEIYHDLSQEEGNDEQATMRRVVLRLMDIEGGELQRRRIPRNELDYDDGAEDERVTDILTQLTGARLLVWSAVEGQPHIELSHDALVQDWQLAKQWRRAEKDEKILLQRRVTKAAAEWATTNNDGEPSLSLRSRLRHLWEHVTADSAEGSVKHLWHDSPYMPQTEQMLAGENRQRSLRRYFFGHMLQPAHKYWLNALEMEFVQRSVNRQRRGRFLTAYIIVFVMVILSIFTAYAIKQQGIAEKNEERAIASEATAIAERDIAVSRQLAAQSPTYLDDQYDLALLLSVQARRSANTLEAQVSQLNSLGHNPKLWTYLHGHSTAITSLSFSPDGKLLASGDVSGNLIIWDLSSYSEMYRISTGHTAPILRLAFDKTGNMLLSASYEKDSIAVNRSPAQVMVWDISTASHVKQLATQTEEYFKKAAISSDAQLVAFVNDNNEVVFWDVGMDQSLSRTAALGYEPNIKFIKDNQTLAWTANPLTEKDGYVELGQTVVGLWDVRQQIEIKQTLLHESQNLIETIELNSNGNLIASASYDGSVVLQDIVTDTPVRKFINSNWSSDIEERGVVFNPAGSLLALGSGRGAIQLYDASTNWSLIETFTGHSGDILSLAFGEDELLASGGRDGKITLWRINQHRLARPITNAQSIIFNQTGQEFAALNSEMITLYDTNSGEKMGQSFPAPQAERLWAFLPDNRLLISSTYPGGNTVQIWDTHTGEQTKQLTHPTFQLNEVALSPNGEFLATTSARGNSWVFLWNMTTYQELAPLKYPNKYFTSIDFSPNSTILASGTSDGEIFLWDITTRSLKSPPLSGHRGRITRVIFSRDGQLIASSGADRVIRIWDVESGKPFGVPLVGHSSSVRDLVFSGDNNILASYGDEDVIILWEIASGQQISRVTAKGDQLAFDPRSGSLKLANVDTIWDFNPASWSELACFTTNRNLSRNEWLRFVGPDKTYKLTCPDAPIHLSMLEYVHELARAGDINEAINQFRLILELKPDLEFDPEMESQRLFSQARAQEFVKQGRQLARIGETNTAIQKFQEAKNLDSTLTFDPEKEAHRIANLITEGEQLATAGKIKKAIVAFNEAQNIIPELAVPARSWNHLCRQASLWGYAWDIVNTDACNLAVELAENQDDEASHRDSRGIAFVMGNWNKDVAHSDFLWYVEWFKKKEAYSSKVKMREMWLEALDKGENPFSEETLELLRVE